MSTFDKRVEELTQSILAEMKAVERVQPGTEDVVMKLHRQADRRVCILVKVECRLVTIQVMSIVSASRLDSYVNAPRLDVSWSAIRQEWQVKPHRCPVMKDREFTGYDEMIYGFDYLPAAIEFADKKMRENLGYKPAAIDYQRCADNHFPLTSLLPKEAVMLSRAQYEARYFAEIELADRNDPESLWDDDGPASLPSFPEYVADF